MPRDLDELRKQAEAELGKFDVADFRAKQRELEKYIQTLEQARQAVEGYQATVDQLEASGQTGTAAHQQATNQLAAAQQQYEQTAGRVRDLSGALDRLSPSRS